MAICLADGGFSLSYTYVEGGKLRKASCYGSLYKHQEKYN